MYQIQEEDEDDNSQENEDLSNTKGREGFNEDGEVLMLPHDNVSIEEPEEGGISKTEGNLPHKEEITP